MREILFRAKRKDNGEWVYGNLITDGEDVFVLVKEDLLKGLDVGGWIDGAQSYEVIPETVGQFTGLTDKNGTKIFEGNILSAHLDDGYPENETMLEVVWHNNGWYGKNGKFFDDFDNGFEKYFEVIGNIYDNNPEMLK